MNGFIRTGIITVIVVVTSIGSWFCTKHLHLSGYSTNLRSQINPIICSRLLADPIFCYFFPITPHNYRRTFFSTVEFEISWKIQKYICGCCFLLKLFRWNVMKCQTSILSQMLADLTIVPNTMHRYSDIDAAEAQCKNMRNHSQTNISTVIGVKWCCCQSK